SDDPCHRSWPPLPARRRRARPQSLTVVAPAQHLSLAGQNGEPRRRCSPHALEWPGPWQTPSVCILNHTAIDSGIPRESAPQRLGISRFCPPPRTCYSAPNICSSLPELRDMPTTAGPRGPAAQGHLDILVFAPGDRTPFDQRHRREFITLVGGAGVVAARRADPRGTLVLI